ncbi:hypothetical protein [Piscinibacter defluvii]|uniref:hypothetical protein n=1 Tax=Piscinibacter defluvii TaxID=1796922 RepID=UPI000FDD6A73|nr:hypothetical protein [Piscinibacter defluvii]
MSDQQANTQPPAMWAVVELLGHNRIAGRVSEQVFAGAAFIRVDVPEIVVSEVDYDESPPVRRQRLIQAHTRSFGAGAIYAVNWCDEDVAREAARGIKHEPLKPYQSKEAVAALVDDARQLRLPGGVVPSDPDDDPEDLDGHGRSY